MLKRFNLKSIQSRPLILSRSYVTGPTFKSGINVELTQHPKPKSEYSKLAFGKEFTDHWLHVNWKKSEGWGHLQISPYKKLELEPSALCFHYALECFEGLKAYKDAKGRIRLFRPEENMKRMNSSANRLCMPTFPERAFLEGIKTLLKTDEDWIPTQRGYSLYLRPTMIATDPVLGVHAPAEVLLFVIASPVGPYYPTGFKPVALYASTKEVRAWPGGTGCYKVGGNYAPGIAPALEASQKGYQQVLWLHENKITEVGTMNLFGFWKNEKGEKELITAPLDGQILPGVTRKSILELARQWGEFKVSEADWNMEQLVRALNEGRVIEMFGAGTAAVVSPVYKIFYEGKDYAVPCKNNEAGDLTRRFMDTILGIQYGEIPSDWSVLVD
eukprot:TRINITY_DN4975_c0_g1_i1.p1 TRINITY_DN4975_c0_g1~~TRINITY_DN4975_c0_g1_i1.p1  ORF type:complete len:386 (-),score=69.37 TRINITY_DN4975_c0_g1_i1:65-1222(-)